MFKKKSKRWKTSSGYAENEKYNFGEYYKNLKGKKMRPILMFTMASCPYCKKAHRYMEELMKETPKYKDIPIKVIDETLDSDTAESYDYYFVPTYYVENEKIHEGAASKEEVHRVFEKAIEE